jgi:hypothetical protein
MSKKKKEGKRPAFQWYPADWRKDPGVQSCSIAARGLWREMMDIAHECVPYGHLTVNGQPMTPAQIARMCGISERECRKYLTELENALVFSRVGNEPEGAIYSRRMVRDHAKVESWAQVGRDSGHMGAEHGVKGGRPTAGANSEGDSETPPHGGLKGPENNPPPPPKITPSSSSSSSSSSDIPPYPLPGEKEDLENHEDPKPPPDPPPVEQAKRIFCDAWGGKYGERYVADKADAKHLEFVLVACDRGGIDLFREAVKAFLADNDHFRAAGAKHHAQKLRQHLNKYLDEGRAALRKRNKREEGKPEPKPPPDAEELRKLEETQRKLRERLSTFRPAAKNPFSAEELEELDRRNAEFVSSMASGNEGKNSP